MNEWKITVMGDWGREDALLAEADVIAGGRRLLECGHEFLQSLCLRLGV